MPADMVPQWHRLAGVRITEPLQNAGWRPNSRVIVDWHARTVGEKHKPFLFRLDDRCHLARLHRSEEGSLVILPTYTRRTDEALPLRTRTLDPEKVQVLGRVVVIARPYEAEERNGRLAS